MGDLRRSYRHYAILVGIDGYSERPLKGCVLDVQEVRKYLEGLPYPVHINMFTATGTSNSPGPVDTPERRPTHENVVSALESVLVSAHLGDCVYFHFSGHGTRLERSSQFSNHSSGDLALNLLDDGDGGGVRYLCGLELAYLLKHMVEKGLVVTLVLDCCFSGSVSRLGNSAIRSLPYDALVDQKYPRVHKESFEAEEDSSRNRGASMSPSWLIHPDGYTVLAACGPHEVAKERQMGNGESRGVLTFWLLSTLAMLAGVERKAHDIYQQVTARFREARSGQNPMFYGNKDLGFFQNIVTDMNLWPIPIVRGEAGAIQLQAGEAHGVCDGDKFSLHSFYGPHDEESLRETDPIVVLVAKVGPLTSVLTPLGTSSSSDLGAGWVARPITCQTLCKYPVLVAGGVAGEWMTRFDQRPWLNIRTSETEAASFSYHLSLTPSGRWGVLDDMRRRIPNLPTISADSQAASELLDVLEHLVKFKAVREIDNQDAASIFQQSFRARIIDRQGRAFNTETPIRALHNEVFHVEVENKGDIPLYVHVYNLCSTWEVSNVLRGMYEVILPESDDDGYSRMKRRFKITTSSQLRELGSQQDEDIIKVFITSKPTSFKCLELPELQGENRDRPDPGLRKIRGTVVDRQSPKVGSEDYAVLNFIIYSSVS